jgi:chromosome segregation and condensation protein ScpB
VERRHERDRRDRRRGRRARTRLRAAPDRRALLDHWRQKLPQGELAVLEVAVAVWPEPVDRERISEVTGYQRSSRDTYLQRLRSRQLVLDAGRGQVRASDNLFNGAAA